MSTQLPVRSCSAPLRVTAGLLAVGLSLVVAAGARAAPQDDNPIVSVGSANVGDGAVNADGTVGSSGQTSACVNGQEADADPSTTGGTAVSLGSCPASTSGETAASTGSTSASGGSSAGGSSAVGSATVGASGGESGSTPGGSPSATATTQGGALVSAADAVGLRIAAVRFLTNGVRTAMRLRVVVALRDSRNRLVSGAAVSLRRLVGARATIAGTRAAFTSKAGLAPFVVPVTKRMLGERLLLVIVAQTPSSQTQAVRGVQLPGPIS
jgi:hypothetical protein